MIGEEAEGAAGTADAGNPEATDAPGADSSVATGDDGKAAEGTPPSADDAPSEGPPTWVSQLDGDLKSNETLTNFKTISELGKAHLELTGKLAAAVTVPAKDATDEEKAAYRKAIGVPDKPTDYKLEKIKLPEGVPENKELPGQFVEQAHKLGLSQTQANELFKWYNGVQVKNLADGLRVVKSTQEETEKDLRTAWGSKYDRRLAFVERAVRPYLAKYPDLGPALAKSGLGNHIGLVQILSRLGELDGDPPFVEGQRIAAAAGSEVGNRTNAELAATIYPDKPAEESA